MVSTRTQHKANLNPVQVTDSVEDHVLYVCMYENVYKTVFTNYFVNTVQYL